MAISQKHLGPDEYVVVTLHTHVKAMLVPALILIATMGLAGFLSAKVGGEYKRPLLALIWIVALVIVAVWSLTAFIKWLTTTYTVTNRRIITRTGIFTRTGHDIPIPRISDVASERHLIDRMLGCGTSSWLMPVSNGSGCATSPMWRTCSSRSSISCIVARPERTPIRT
ncbi:MAG: PH domain-containing protein [Nocardioidaceae bacterium]|nr:MAG: PH domain-containing protein [Nocardioidaceae bacterium]